MSRLPLVLLLAAAPVSAQDLSAYRSDAAAAQVPFDDATRAVSADALQATLYEVVALKHADHQAHWNVVGQNFYALHDLLGDLYAAFDPHVDQIAERKRALGAPADGAPGRVAAGADLPALPDRLLEDYEVPMLLSAQYATVSARLHERIAAVGDTPTQDLLIAVTAEVEKRLCMLRSLQRGGDAR